MKLPTFVRILTAAAITTVLCAPLTTDVVVHAQSHPDLTGHWILNRDLSAFPKEVGFDPDWIDSTVDGSGSAGRSDGSGGGGRGGRGGGAGSSGGGSIRLAPPSAHFISQEDSKKIKELVDEVKTPPAQLTISRTDASVTIVDGRGAPRVLHTNGREDIVQLTAGAIVAVTKWEGVELLVRYEIDKDQELRCRYSQEPGTGRLVVRSQFATRGRGEVITRLYDSAPAPTS